MSSLLTKLFPARTRPIRKPARARLGVESLADRIVPAAAVSLNAAGVLSIDARISTQGVDVKVDYALSGLTTVFRVSETNGPTTSFSPLSVKKVLFTGSESADVFTNYTAVLTEAWSGNGDDKIGCMAGDNTLVGGGGNDTLTVGAGNNRLYGETGRDTLGAFAIAVGSSFLSIGATGNDLLDGGSENDSLFGGGGVDTLNGGSGDDYLSGGQGNDVFVGSPGGDKYLGGDGADFLGRGGHRGYFADGQPEDATTGLVTGTLSYGELTAPGTSLFARRTPGDPTRLEVYGPSGAGFTLKASNWTATTLASNVPWMAPLGTIFKASGGSVELETGRGYTIPLPASAFANVLVARSAAGTDVGPVVSSLSLDLATIVSDAVGGFKDKVGVGSLSLPTLSGGLQLGANLGSLNLPVAPAVPYLYAALDPNLGVSLGGLSASIPTPGSGWGLSVAVDPTDLGGMVRLAGGGYEVGFGWSTNGEIPYTPSLVPEDRSDPQIAGNLYIHASGQLPGLPVSVAGDVVLDLDANNDGAWAGLTADSIGKMLKGKASLDQLASAVNDIKFGVNGELSASLPISKSFDVDMTLGRGSLYWTPAAGNKPGEAAFRVGSVNPFEGTAFAGYFGGVQFDVQGRFDTHGDFRLAAKSYTDLDFKLGDLSVGSCHQSFGVEFRKDGSVVSLGAAYHFDVTAGDMSYLGARLSVDAQLSFGVNVSTGAVSVSGGGSVTGDICMFGYNQGVNAGVSFDNHGAYVDLPGSVLDFRIKW